MARNEKNFSVCCYLIFFLAYFKQRYQLIFGSFVAVGLIKQFLKDVDWGEIDYLVVDTPPGTSDEHISLAQYLKMSHIDGCVIITTPQEVALSDVRKEITFCKKVCKPIIFFYDFKRFPLITIPWSNSQVGLPIIGIVENMAGFVCPSCKVGILPFLPSPSSPKKEDGRSNRSAAINFFL